MKWKGRRRSTNVEDRRGQPASRGVRGGGGRGGAGMIGLLLSLFARGSMKTKLILVVVAVVAMTFFGGGPEGLLGSLSGGGGSSGANHLTAATNDEMLAYLSTMKADNEDIWAMIFRKHERAYRPAKLVIYSDTTDMPGGVADARMGPFYMPSNETIYIDPTFFNDLRTRFGAPGDFAQAYVLAHEVGHHVQNLLGYTDKVDRQRGRVSKTEYNRLSVRLELQADFLAGVFARHADEQFDFLENGDIKEAMNCAHAIGDDHLLRSAGRKVAPDSFTHGTSEQRVRWFMKGFKTGRLEDGDTFGIPYGDL